MKNHIEDASKISHIYKGIWTLEDIDKPESEV